MDTVTTPQPPQFTKVYSPHMSCEMITRKKGTPCSSKGRFLNLEDGLRYCGTHANVIRRMHESSESAANIDASEDHPSCAICISPINPDIRRGQHKCYRTHPCGHPFHRGCLKRWVQIQKDTVTDQGVPVTISCPLCRAPLHRIGRFANSSSTTNTNQTANEFDDQVDFEITFEVDFPYDPLESHRHFAVDLGLNPDTTVISLANTPPSSIGAEHESAEETAVSDGDASLLMYPIHMSTSSAEDGHSNVSANTYWEIMRYALGLHVPAPRHRGRLEELLRTAPPQIRRVYRYFNQLTTPPPF